MPVLDLVRTYLLCRLSKIGGDPAAAMSILQLARKMTTEQVELALS